MIQVTNDTKKDLADQLSKFLEDLPKEVLAYRFTMSDDTYLLEVDYADETPE